MAPEKLSPAVAIPQIRERLEHGELCRVVVTGSSMWPGLRHEKDAVILAPLERPVRRGDVLFYLRAPTVCVLHRVVELRADGAFDVCGDAQTEKEVVRPEQVLGVVSHVERGGRRFPVSAPGWRLYSALWRALLPLRGRILPLLRALGGHQNKGK